MWKLKEYKRAMFKIIEVIDENGEVIKTFVADDLDYSRKKKQAQVMAAAPELLEALKIVNDVQCNFPSWWYEQEFDKKVEKAINKAKGDGKNFK